MKATFFISLCKTLNCLGGWKLRWNFLWICLLNIGVVIFEMGVAGAISLFGLVMTNPETLGTLPVLGRLIDMVPRLAGVAPSLHSLMVVLGLVIVASFGKNLLSAYLTWRQTCFAQEISWAVSEDLFSKTLYAPYIWHIQKNSTDILTLINWRAALASFLTYVFVISTQLFIACALVCASIWVTPLPALAMFTSVGIAGYFTYAFSRKLAYACGNKLASLDMQSSRVTMHGVHSFQAVAIADRQNDFLAAFHKVIPAYIPASAKQALFLPLPSWVLEIFGLTILLCILVAMTMSGESAARASTTMALLAATAWRMLPAMNKFVGALLAMKGLQSIVERMMTALHDTPAAGISGPRTVRKLCRDMTLNQIGFSYPDAKQPALKNVSMRIPAGSFVGVIGLSGSGKSTLINIATGLYRPQTGSISVDGTVLDPASERLALGYVPQSLYLLDSTLADNVAFRILDESIDEDRVRECCAQAAMTFVDDLPEGMHTMLGERGVRLSGGQIQRIGIARALYSKPDLLIFDEATSALDGAAEQAIQNTVDSLRSSLTVLIIAHRLTTVEHCDRIYWLDNGVVRMEGTPQEVLPVYKKYMDDNVVPLYAAGDSGVKVS